MSRRESAAFDSVRSVLADMRELRPDERRRVLTFLRRELDQMVRDDAASAATAAGREAAAAAANEKVWEEGRAPDSLRVHSAFVLEEGVYDRLPRASRGRECWQRRGADEGQACCLLWTGAAWALTNARQDRVLARSAHPSTYPHTAYEWERYNGDWRRDAALKVEKVKGGGASSPAKQKPAPVECDSNTVAAKLEKSDSLPSIGSAPPDFATVPYVSDAPKLSAGMEEAMLILSALGGEDERPTGDATKPRVAEERQALLPRSIASTPPRSPSRFSQRSSPLAALSTASLASHSPLSSPEKPQSPRVAKEFWGRVSHTPPPFDTLLGINDVPPPGAVKHPYSRPRRLSSLSDLQQ